MVKEETPNHSLNKYDQGDAWDYNEDMDHIDERLVIRDTEANRSSYTPHDGALFIATDTGAEYDGDGSSWNKADRGYGSLSADHADTRNGYVDETANRSFGTWYQNTTGADLDVSVIASASSDSTNMTIVLDVNSSQSNFRVDEFTQTIDSNDHGSVQATVPDGFYYQVRAFNDTANFSIDEWREQT